MKDKFEKELLSTNKVEIIGNNATRSSYISNVYFIDRDIDEIVLPLSSKVAFSTGSACNSKIVKPSHVLTSMGYNDTEASRCLRFSFGKYTTEDDVNYTIQEIKKLL